MSRILFHTVPFAQAAVAQGRALWLTVEGDSMRPILRPGDRILIQPGSSLRPGNLITFTDGTDLCTHRLIGKAGRARKTVLFTKGDLSCRWDQPIPVEAVLGKVIAVQKGSRALSMDGSLWHFLDPILSVVSVVFGGLLYLKWKISRQTA